MSPSKKKPWIKYALMISLGLGIFTAVGVWIRRNFARKHLEKTQTQIGFQSSISGLSQAEAQHRKSDSRKNDRMLAEKQVLKDQIKRRIFSIFNLTMLVLAVTQVFLGDIWGALGTLGALTLNVAVSVFQQTRSAKQVGKLIAVTRPRATVLREGMLNNIDQDDIVIGDVLVAGNGDEIFTDGTVLESSNLLIDISPFAHSPTIEEKFDGDRLTAGSFCEGGWAIYRVDHIPDGVDEDQISIAATPISEARTPLQKGIQLMLLILLVIAGIFYAILITELYRLDYFPSDLILIYRQAISVIFSIAPSGLLFMVIINYAVGSANIAKAGALIRSSQTIEGLAEISSLLLIRKRDLDSLTLQIEMIPDEMGEFHFTESRTMQLLGNYFRSMPSVQFPFSIIKDELEGNRYPVKREIRFFSVLGWEAVNFDSDDMLGTYVIGYPEFLHPYLETPLTLNNGVSQPGVTPEEKTGIKGKFSNLFSKIRPKKVQMESFDDPGLTQKVDAPPLEEPNRWQRLKNRLRPRSKHQEKLEINDLPASPEEDTNKVIQLLFAYAPGTLPDNSSTPQPPAELIPICYLNIVMAYRPDVKTALEAIRQAGISFKIFTSGKLRNVDGLAKVLDIEDRDTLASQIISGDEVNEKITANERETICEKTVYYQHSTEQMSQVINILRDEGQFVALQSLSKAEIPMMSQVDINITTQGSSNKVISKSDVVIIDSFPARLPVLFQMGQNIVHSVVNLLKINLTEIGYVLILIILMFLTGSRRFVYEPVHGGIIGIFTITLPSFFISLWTNSLKADRQKIRSQLRMYIIPAAITIALVVVFTFLLFDWRGYPFTQIQQVITHLLVVIGLLQVVFCYPPIPLLSGNGTYTSDLRLTWVALILFVLFNALTFLPLFQRYLRVYPLVSFLDYGLIWAIGLGWGLMILLIWRLGWNRLARRS